MNKNYSKVVLPQIMLIIITGLIMSPISFGQGYNDYGTDDTHVHVGYSYENCSFLHDLNLENQVNNNFLYDNMRMKSIRNQQNNSYNDMNNWYNYSEMINGWYNSSNDMDMWMSNTAMMQGWYNPHEMLNSWYKSLDLNNEKYTAQMMMNGWYETYKMMCSYDSRYTYGRYDNQVNFNNQYNKNNYKGMMRGGDCNSAWMNNWNSNVNHKVLSGLDKTVNFSEFNANLLIDLKDLNQNVENFVKAINMNYEIDVILTFTNSDYYYSIKDSESGKGVLELQINPLTGVIYPEFGPNMMWNTNFNISDMNSRNGMNNLTFRDDFKNNDIISLEESIILARKYFENLDMIYDVDQEGLEFSGYYTLYVKDNNKTIGLLSVNYYTGDIWYHAWHGDVKELINN